MAAINGKSSPVSNRSEIKSYTTRVTTTLSISVKKTPLQLILQTQSISRCFGNLLYLRGVYSNFCMGRRICFLQTLEVLCIRQRLFYFYCMKIFRSFEQNRISQPSRVRKITNIVAF